MAATDSDDALLAACLAGQREAFAELVERYKDLVCALTLGATGDRTLAEDLAQETFLVAWRGLPTLREPPRFRAWVCGIARNLGRAARRERGREVPIAELPELPVDASLVDALAEDEEEALVWRTLASMPASYREPLVLYHRQGMSTAEVADTLGLSVEAAQQRLCRGRKQLKDTVSALVERTLERARPRKGFVGAVIAALGTQGLATSASAAPTAARIGTGWRSTRACVTVASKVLAVAALATAVTHGCIAWHEPDGPAPTAEPGTRASLEAEPPVASAHPSGEWTDVTRRRATMGDEVRWPQYELTELSHSAVAVALGGGRSSLRTAAQSAGEPEPILRTVSGRVRDRDGAPLQDAVVIAGSQLAYVLDDSLTGQRGTRTDAQGRFAIGIRHADPIVVLALHEHGWSTLVAVEAGRRDREIDLRVQAPARLEGSLKKSGMPMRPEVWLGGNGQGLSMRVLGDAHGRFEISALPPGRYDVSVGPQSAGAPDARRGRTLAFVAGKTVTWHADLDAGPSVLAETRVPTGMAPDVAVYTMVPGHAPTTSRELRERVSALPRHEYRHALVGGDDLDGAMEFADVPRGRFAVCAQLQRGPEPLAFGCTEVDVRASADVHEIVIAPVPGPREHESSAPR